MPTFNDCSITRIVEDIIEHLDPETYRWFVVSPEDGETIASFTKLGAWVKNYKVNNGGQPVGVWAASRNLRRMVQEQGIDIVHAHTPATTVTTWLGMPFSSQPATLYTKHLLTFPGDRKNGWLYTAVDRVSLYMADHLMPVSRTMGDIIAGWPLISRERVTPIQNAIDYTYFNAPDEREACRAEFGFKPEDVVFGFTGRIEPVKRLDLMLRAFATLYPENPNARLLLAGIGGQMDELKALAAELGVTDGVTWAGWRSDVPRLLAAMDVYVQSSANEGLSLSILEAMSAGKAVVATDVGGAHEIIEQQSNGIIVPPEELEPLARAMQDVFHNDAKRAAMGSAGQALVERDFNVQRMTSDYDQLYRKYAPVVQHPQAIATP
ncbi:glycosyltransferase family 4 protein [bacterium]|nr:glycosyltransferase family 4 protein [bacterium]